MSRWLKSVNNLLENLDGQAENVDIDGTIGQLIEKGQQVAKTLQRDDSFHTESQGEELLDEEEEYGDDDDIDYDIDVVVDDFNDNAFDNEIDGEVPLRHEKIAEGEELSESGVQEEVDGFCRQAHETSDRQTYIHADAVGELSCTEGPVKTHDAELKEEECYTDKSKIPNQSSCTDSNRKNKIPPTNSSSAPVTKTSSKSQQREIDVSTRPPKRLTDTDGIEERVSATKLEGGDKSDGASSKQRNSTDSLSKALPHLFSVSLSKSQPASFAKTSVLNIEQSSQLVADSEVRKLAAKLQSIQEKLTKTLKELKASNAENKKLEKQVAELDSQLRAANSEIHAQGEELRRAGERMEKDRRLAQEEREELLDDQDEEIEQLKALHSSEIDALKTNYEKQLDDIKEKLESEVARRAQEGGNWNKEYDNAVNREQEALKDLSDANRKASSLEIILSKQEAKVGGLESKVESAVLCAKEAERRQQEAEDKLDAALSQHARQLNQRQSREAELEKTIFDLGSALTEAKRVQQSSTKHLAETQPTGDTNFKEKYEAAVEELETLRVQLKMETQRRAALENELNEISKERSEEIAMAQSKQLQQDRKVADLETRISQLKSSLHAFKAGGLEIVSEENNRMNAFSNAEFEEARHEIAKLSDQLMRHQRMAESSKSEILALKGRLQSATSRAETAERSLLTVQSSSEYPTRRSFDVESMGFSSSRRRVKGARRHPISVGRTIRASLNIDHGALSNILEQVVSTIDALDRWMVDTGRLMRNEPLARLCFLTYLVTIHLWTFGLVIFHTVETPHGDFGTMDTNPRHWRNHT